MYIFTNKKGSPQKKKKKKPAPKPPEGFDSFEEWYISWWMDELKASGYISTYILQPHTFLLSEKELYTRLTTLKTKTKETQHAVIQQHVYTPDALIYWEEKAIGVFCKHYNREGVFKEHEEAFFWSHLSKKQNKQFSLVETKGLFDQNNMTRAFIINQKWLMKKYRLYCNLAIPEKLFQKTFTPMRFLRTNKSMQPRKLKYKPRILNEFLEGR